MKRIFGVLGVLLLAGTVQALPAVEWRFPAYPLRTVFTVPDGACSNVMLRVSRVGDMPVSRSGFLASGPDGSLLPVRVVWAEGAEVVLAVEASRSESGPCAVYYGASPTNEPVPSSEAAAVRTPLAVGFVALNGRAIPNSWERMLHMLRSPRDKIATPHRVAGFDEIDAALGLEEAEKGAHERHGRRRQRDKVRVALVRSFLLCPREGTYRFAVDCRDAGFVVVDNELVAAWPGEHASGAWQVGVPIALKTGVHRVEVLNTFGGGESNLRVGWVPPGRKEVEPLGAPDLIAACEAMETRAERMNRTLQPGFVATPVRAYSFRGNPAVFVAVQFKGITENWITPDMESHWKFGDGTQSQERDPVHVYKAADVFRASLEVRDALGFVASCSDPVDCRQVQPEEYAVSFDLTGLPAVCFERDKVAPFLRIQGVGPSGVACEVTWESRHRSGVLEQGRQKIVPQGEPQLVALASVTGGELETLTWRVSYRQVRLGGETIRFVKPPLSTMPARIEGDRLYAADGARLVLVPEEGPSAFQQAATGPVRQLGRLVCVDDSLAVAGFVEADGEPFDRILARLLKGRMEDVRYVALPEWDRFEASFGPLRKLIDVPAALRRERADVAILSIGLRDILTGKDAESFERQAAALSDVVAATRKTRMVWVTPPPYPSATERSRVFAAAIRRVAEARNIPVADLFTAFRCAADSRHVFFQENSLMLSDQGHRLAGQQIVRALMGE